MKSGVTDFFGLTAGTSGAATGTTGLPSPLIDVLTLAMRSGRPEAGKRFFST